MVNKNKNKNNNQTMQLKKPKELKDAVLGVARNVSWRVENWALF